MTHRPPRHASPSTFFPSPPEIRRRPPGPGPVRRSIPWTRIAIAGALLALVAATAAAVVNAGQASARGPLPPAAVSLPADAQVSRGRVLVSLPWGNGPGAVGLESPGEGLRRGPEAMAVGADGAIAVLDSVNRRVLLLTAGGEPTLTIPVDLAEPRFLALTDSSVYVLDCGDAGRIQGWDRRGSLVMDRLLALPADPPVTALLISSGLPCVETGHDRVYRLDALAPPNGLSLAEAGEGAAPAGGSAAALPGRPAADLSSHVIQARFSPQTGLRIRLLTPDGSPAMDAPSLISVGTAAKLEHLVSVDTVANPGDLVVGARLLGRPTGSSGGDGDNQASLIVARIPADGSSRRPAAILLTESAYAYVGQPYVVGPSGDVYQPVASPDGYSIVLHTLPEGGAR
jgi:hypothetical protein